MLTVDACILPHAVDMQDKWDRMKAVIRRYIHGDLHALDKFPIGDH